MKELIGKKVKIWIKDLSVEPIIYTCTVLSADDNFIRIEDKIGDKITIKIDNIIQIKELDNYEMSGYQQ